MTELELRKIKARVVPTICDTYRSENGYAEARVEGRISKADFEALCGAVLGTTGGQLCASCIEPVDIDWTYCPGCGAQGRLNAAGEKI